MTVIYRHKMKNHVIAGLTGNLLYFRIDDFIIKILAGLFKEVEDETEALRAGIVRIRDI